jgi:asparagine synthase (glutamine-hydrolysing)
MCGITGIVDANQSSLVERATLHRMCETIKHRGPDDEGIYVKDGVGLGIRRLSIIDVSGGHQPVHNEDKTIWVVCNGEIYNFPELRAELERSGHQFYTNTDTEVIVHLYEELGIECVQKLRGMFGIGLYDERSKRLLLVRDRLGKKPLHYALNQGRLVFGSEIKSLLAAAPELTEIDQDALLQYFYFGYIPDPATAFRRIKKLPPGYLLQFEDGRPSVRQYWNLPAYGSTDPKSDDEYLDEMERGLTEAVRMRLISDVPLGALLSGGVDSATIVALMAQMNVKPVKTFTIGFSHQDFNEATTARRVAQHFGTDHHELIVEPRVGETLHHLSRTLEEPFADSSILPTYYVSCLARQHVTVALSGDGGDELFAGYNRYAVSLRRQIFEHIPDWGGRWLRESVYPRLPTDIRGRNWMFSISLSARDQYLDRISFLPVFERERALFSSDFLASARTLAPPLQGFRRYFDDAPAVNLLSRILYLDTKTYLPGDILTKVDRMSMATSLEVRSPILDHVFVEWATRLPENLKFRNGKGKYLLRKFAERVGVPREVLHGPKRGFALPLVDWMRSEIKDDLLAILVEPRTLERGYFNPLAIRNLLEEHWSRRRDRSGELWVLLMFELWHRNFLEVTCAEQRKILTGTPTITLNSTV